MPSSMSPVMNNDDKKGVRDLIPEDRPLPEDDGKRDIFAPEVRRIIREFQTMAVRFDRRDQRLKSVLRDLSKEGVSWEETCDKAQIGYFLLDSDGYIERANSVGLRLLNISGDTAFHGIPLAHCFPAHHRNEFKKVWEELKRVQGRQSLLLGRVTGDARKEVPFRLELRSIGQLDARIGYAEAALIDIGAWHDAEAALLAVRHDLERRLYRRTHDLQDANRNLQREMAERREYEKALRESEGRYRTLVESFSDAVLILDRDRNIVSCNDAFLHLFGYSREEVVGASVSIIHPSDQSFRSFGERAYPIVWNMGFFRTEWDLRRKDGTLLPTETITSVMRSSDHSILGYVAVIRDISSRKRIERVLAHQRELLQTIVDNVPAMIGILEKNGRVGFVNRAFERILGLTIADMHRENLLTIALPDPRKRAEVLRYIKESPVGWRDFRVTTSTSEEVDTSWATVELTDGSRLGIGIDISERKRAERELSESRAFIRRIAETSPYLLYLYDIKARKNVFANRQFYLTLGYAAEEIDAFGEDAVEVLVHPDDQQRVLAHVGTMAAAETDEVSEIEYRIRQRGGQLRWLLDRAVVFERDPNGTPTKILCTALDITARKQDEEKIRQLTEELAMVQENERLRFARDLHDSVAQDLCALKIGMDTIFDTWPDVPSELNQRMKQLSTILQRSISEVQILAHDLRPFNLEFLCLSRAVAQYTENFCDATEMDCELDIDDVDDARLNLDARINIMRLLQEILNNVRKHAAASSVFVGLKSDDFELSLSVRDNGKGFDVAERERASLGENRMGFLGMRERVAALRGKMNVTSQPNAGSNFAVVVPYGEKRSAR